MKDTMYSVRRALFWVTFLQVLIITQIASVSAVPDTVVKVEPETSTADIGETFTINIKLTDVQNLFGLEVTLQWDASILQMVSADVRLGIESYPDGVLHEISETASILIYQNQTIQEQGKYLLAASSSAPAPSFNGSGNIVRIIFNVTSVGSCDLNLETKLADKPPPGGVSSPIMHTTVDGFFSLEAPEEPTAEEPTVWPYVTIIVVVGIVVGVTATAIYRSRKQKRLPSKTR